MVFIDIQLVGFDDFDGFTVEKVKEEINNLLNKWKRMLTEKGLISFKLAVDKVREREHTDYQVKGHVHTNIGDFYASKKGWKILDVVDEVLSNLDRQVTEKNDEIEAHRKLPGNV